MSDRPHLGWALRSVGPAQAQHTVLLLPGGLSTAAQALCYERGNPSVRAKVIDCNFGAYVPC
jgi:hypothetical protein